MSRKNHVFFILLILFTIISSTNLLAQNPIIPNVQGADPEVIYSENTRLYYMYPTMDGNGFRAYTSTDLVNWKNEGKILDIKNVVWENKMTWAPSILEKKIYGKYRYFFYFCAGEKIGVATGDSPLGPFNDKGSPLFDKIPEGVPYGVTIDPDAFTDPETGKDYIYWGNGFVGAAELADDHISIRPETFRVVTPAYYGEGPHVFYRKGIYYLTWSQGDTRSPDYHLRYLVADNPMGPFDLPKGLIDNTFLKKDDEKQIYGPGHHSCLQIPGTDNWLVYYHRLLLPLFQNPWAREICADKMEFAPDGKIVPIIPTHEGIEPFPLKK